MANLSITTLTLVITWGALVVNNPYLMAALFGQVLVLVSCLLGRYRKFIGFILFLVYVGGIIILIRYCVILMPSNKFARTPIIIAPVIGALGVSLTQGVTIRPTGSFAYGLLYRARAIFLVALLLYLVILAIVDIINYSRGIMKIYVKYRHLRRSKVYNLSSSTCCN